MIVTVVGIITAPQEGVCPIFSQLEDMQLGRYPVIAH